MVVLNAVQSVLSIVLMILLGYYLSHKGWFNESTSVLFTRLVVNVSLPAMMVNNILTTFDREMLRNAGAAILIPFVSILACFFAALLTAKLIKVRPDRRGIFITMFFSSNTIFMGMPVNLALFGEKSVPYVLFYFAASTTTFWTIGQYYIRSSIAGEKKGMLQLESIKRIFSPPLLSFLFSLLLILAGASLPRFVMDTCKYLGNLTTPLSLMFIGMTFYSINIKEIKINRDMLALVFGRFVLSPAIIYLLSGMFAAGTLMTQVFIIQAAMPIITQSAIITKAYKGDYQYAAVMVTVTTIISMVFIPIYMVLFTFM